MDELCVLRSKWEAIVVIISVKFHTNFEHTGFNNSLMIFRIFRKCFNYFNTYERSRSHTAGIFFYNEMFIEKFTINENPYVHISFPQFFLMDSWKNYQLDRSRWEFEILSTSNLSEINESYVSSHLKTQRYHFFVLQKNLSFILRFLKKKKRRKKAGEEGTKGRKKRKAKSGSET